jgi:hypothetical protein
MACFFVISREIFLPQKSPRQLVHYFQYLKLWHWQSTAAPSRQRSRRDYPTIPLDGLPESLPTPGLDLEATYYMELVPPFAIEQAHIT